LFHFLWIEYCIEKNIPFKLVNCYDTNIIEDLEGCSCLMWHYSQSNFRDLVMAKSLLFSLEQSGMKVFPDFNSAWHFDDKVGQKYLLEALHVDWVKTWTFYEASSVLKWIDEATFPKVFKLRGGAGSQNVKLIYSKSQARKLVRIAFGKGFPAYDGWESLKERFRKWQLKKADFKEVIKGLIRLVKPPRYALVMGNELNYVYFQEFVPNNDSDTRIIIID
jgi:hypothetical protein